MTDIVYFLLGIVAALLGSMAGLGGGFLAIPVLYYMGVPPQYVVGTSKFMVFVNSIVSTYRYSKRIRIPVKLYIAVVVPMMATAYVGAYLVAILPSTILVLVIGTVLLVGSIRMLTPSPVQAEVKTNKREEGEETSKEYLLGIASGLLAGIIAGISGLGGGIVNVPVFIYILGLNPHQAVSLSMACILPSAFSSVIRHQLDHVIDWNIAIPLSIGATLGGWIGPRIALRIEKEKLRKIIGVIIAIATTRILVEAIIELTS